MNLLRRIFGRGASVHPDMRPPPVAVAPTPPPKPVVQSPIPHLNDRALHPDMRPPPPPIVARSAPSPRPSPPQAGPTAPLVPPPPVVPPLPPASTMPPPPPLPSPLPEMRVAPPPLRQPPPLGAVPPPLADRVEIHRSAGIVRLLATSSIERPRIARTVQAILAEFPHHTSVAALTRLVENGATLDDLVACSEIKLRWREDTTFWVRRDRAGRIGHDPRLRHSLSWQAAARLIAALGAEAMSRLEDELLDEWLTMRAHSIGDVPPGWWSLAAFVSVEACQMDAWRAPPSGWERLDDDVLSHQAPRIPAWTDPRGRTGLRGIALPPMDAGAWSRPMAKLSKVATSQSEETDDAG